MPDEIVIGLQMKKPHIWYNSGQAQWHCCADRNWTVDQWRSEGFTSDVFVSTAKGYGATPEAAYDEWAEKLRDYEYGPS